MTGLALNALLALAGAAHAGCDDRNTSLPTGPVQAWLTDGMVGLAQPTCMATSLGVAPRAALLVDTPAFYGNIGVTATLDATFAPDDRTSLGLALEPVHYESVISALSTSWLGYGATTLTAARRVDRDDAPVELAMVARVAVPTPVDRTNNPVLAADVGLAVASRPAPLEGHAQFGLSASGGLAGPVDLRTGLPVTAGLGWSAGRAFGLAADLQSSFGTWAPVDHVAVAPAVRFAGPRWGAELGASLPIAGADRTLTAVRLGWRWFPAP
jgi:hypothetical protein